MKQIRIEKKNIPYQGILIPIKILDNQIYFHYEPQNILVLLMY